MANSNKQLRKKIKIKRSLTKIEIEELCQAIESENNDSVIDLMDMLDDVNQPINKHYGNSTATMVVSRNGRFDDVINLLNLGSEVIDK